MYEASVVNDPDFEDEGYSSDGSELDFNTYILMLLEFVHAFLEITSFRKIIASQIGGDHLIQPSSLSFFC